MEPTITFVGFAASLVTLIAVVGDSAQTVHTLWCNFRDSPTNLKRLINTIADNEALLKDMQAVSNKYERVGIPESLLSRWKSMSTTVNDDFRELNMEMNKILECTKGSELTKKHLRRRVRHFFSEKVLEDRCQQLSAHQASMSYIHSLMHRYVGISLYERYAKSQSSSYIIQIGEKLHSFRETSESLQQETLSKLNTLQESLETTQTDLIQAVQSELGRFTNPRAIQQAFHIFTDESTDYARPSRPGMRSPESPVQCSGIIDNRDTSRHPSSGLLHTVEWHSHKYRFVIGTLQIEHVESVDVEMKEGEHAFAQLVCYRSKRARFTFTPPSWFSSLIMKIDISMRIEREGRTPSINWSPISNGRRLEPLLEELHQISNLTLDKKLLAIAGIGELDYLFKVYNNPPSLHFPVKGSHP